MGELNEGCLLLLPFQTICSGLPPAIKTVLLKYGTRKMDNMVKKIDCGSSRQIDDVKHVHFSSDGQYLAASGFGHSAVYACVQTVKRL